VATLLVTIMRKMAGQLKAGGRRNATVVTVTATQKILLGVTLAIFIVEMFVSGIAMRAAKTVCWVGILGNAWYHFVYYNLDLGAAFGDISPARALTSPVSFVDRQKVLRVKAKLKTNMYLVMGGLNLMIVAYIWWPEGKNSLACRPRPSGDFFMTTRFILASIGGILQHVSVLQAIWMFKKKKKSRHMERLDDRTTRYRYNIGGPPLSPHSLSCAYFYYLSRSLFTPQTKFNSGNSGNDWAHLGRAGVLQSSPAGKERARHNPECKFLPHNFRCYP
jgi:hypothetical protein